MPKIPKAKIVDRNRKKVPHDVRALVIHESGYRCANPCCRTIITLDVHHMMAVSLDGKDIPENLLPLCGLCHDLHHLGKITEKSIRAWKFLLLALNEAFDRRSVDLLLLLSVQGEIVCSGDGIISIASLFSSGFIDIQRQFVVSDSGCPTREIVYRVLLNSKGLSFVDAWKSGDQAAAVNLPNLKTSS
jgi:hypothetical protein